MNFSNLRDHLFIRNLIDSPLCVCGNGRETTSHYLCSCPQYMVQRMTLDNAIATICDFPLETNLLLHGHSNLTLDDNVKIIEATQAFICDTLRFRVNNN